MKEIMDVTKLTLEGEEEDERKIFREPPKLNMIQFLQWRSDNELAWWERMWSYNDVQEILVTREHWWAITSQRKTVII